VNRFGRTTSGLHGGFAFIYGCDGSSMSSEEAKFLGYEVFRVSDIEVGLCKNGVGIRTWWASDFERIIPTLDHPKILACISAREKRIRDG
jgi:hypothetical protein